MQDIDLFLPDVFTHVVNCPEPLALRMIRDAARQYCRRVMDWKEWETMPVSTPECEALTATQDAMIVRIEAARFTIDGQTTDLTPKTNSELDEILPDWETYEDTPRYVTQLTPNTVTVAPRATGSLRVRLVLQPTRDALSLPDYLLDLHGVLIGKGAAAMILKTPGDHANPQLAVKLEGEFQRGLAVQFNQASRGQHRAARKTIARFL